MMQLRKKTTATQIISFFIIRESKCVIVYTVISVANLHIFYTAPEPGKILIRLFLSGSKKAKIFVIEQKLTLRIKKFKLLILQIEDLNYRKCE
jgi:hypothetical protein